jgi:glycosyltransferase involved in cell wall biosynthesis
MKILFVYQSSGKSVYFESLSHHLRASGLEVESLFFCETGHLQKRLEEESFKCFNYQSKYSRFIFKTFENTFHLIGFARKTKPDFIFSHLGNANLYATGSSYFLPKTKVIVCRHNADESYITKNRKAIFLDKLINRFASQIVVVSKKAYNHLVEVEKVEPKKLHFLPLAYDFDRYEKDEEEPVLSKKTGTVLRVIFISRLVDIKRIDAFFPVIKYFKEKNIRIEMQIIGDGPLENDLKKQAQQLDISDSVQFLGFKENVIPYIKAADCVVHLSVSESSNQVVKEAGLCGKTVIACKGVGDFDAYLDETNAYRVERNFREEDLIQVIEQLIKTENMVRTLHQAASITEGVIEKGNNLRTTVLERFSFQDKIVNQYLSLFKQRATK